MAKKRLPKLKSQIPNELRYQASIGIVTNDLLKLFKKFVYPVLSHVTKSISERVDDEASTLDTALGKVRVTFEKRYKNKDYERIAQKTANSVNNVNSANNTMLFLSIANIQPTKFEPWLNAETNLFVNQNVSLIKTLPQETFSDIEQMLYRDGRRGLSVTKLKEQIIERFDATDNQSALIARDQVNKFNGSLTELRQTKAGIEEYTWLTSQDGRVRHDHDILNNTIQKWDKPPITVRTGKRSGERNHPGQDIQCRCNAIPVIKKR